MIALSYGDTAVVSPPDLEGACGEAQAELTELSPAPGIDFSCSVAVSQLCLPHSVTTTVADSRADLPTACGCEIVVSQVVGSK